MKKIKKFKGLMIIVLIVLISLIILLIKKDDIKLWKLEQTYVKQGYFVCHTFECIPEKLNKCEKAFFRVGFKNIFVDKLIYENNEKCIFQIIKSDKEGLECVFDINTWKGKDTPNINASNYKLFPESKDACKLKQF